MSSKTAEDMIWHDKDRDKKEGILRHPADGSAWKDFDDKYRDFSSDPRSVRLGLASDGFNPYRLMNTTYSTWPVVLMIYNLPPWLCMKRSSIILSSIIPGKSSPGIDIDVFLQPLVDELKLLWEGIDAFDAYKKQNFKLRAAFMWRSTKGYHACPSCAMDTCTEKLAGKICYKGYHKWLPIDHPYRSQAHLFDGKKEYGVALTRQSGTEARIQQQGVAYTYGTRTKKSKKKRTRQEDDDDDDDDDEGDDIDKKSKDNDKVRKAMKEVGIKPHLWIQTNPNGQSVMPPASFSMSKDDKERFLRVFEKLSVPNGYCFNHSRCVNMKQKKLQNLKSHDNHVIMQDLLPGALRASRTTEIADLVSNLSSFFKIVCSTTLDVNVLDEIQTKIILTLCKMEIEFVPTFFTIMVHLVIHFVEEAKLGGPVHYRWMYPIERYLAHLISFVSNKARPEGSIAEGYHLEETINFCSRYLEELETIFNRLKRNDDHILDTNAYLFNSGGRVIGAKKNARLDAKSLEQAHRYILLHCDEMAEFRDEFLWAKRRENRFRGVRGDSRIEYDWIIKEFSDWLKGQVHNIDCSTEQGKLKKALAGGLYDRIIAYKGFAINGYKFLTVNHERYRKTQNSGVMVEANGLFYYGKVTNIYELSYYGTYRVVVFRCDWADISKGLKKYGNGATSVNFSKLMHSGRMLQDDPFIFSSQAKQVFFVEDEIQKGWLHVIESKPRDLFDLGDE